MYSRFIDPLSRVSLGVAYGASGSNTRNREWPAEGHVLLGLGILMSFVFVFFKNCVDDLDILCGVGIGVLVFECA
jgi:hypothetical protein